MKKFTIASILALAAISASALEVGVTTTTDYSGDDHRQAFGATVGQQYGKINVTGGFQRFTSGVSQDRYSVVAGYDVAKVGVFTITPKVGAAYLNNAGGSDGYAMTVGAGVSVPVAKQVTVGIDFARQFGQDRVKASDGNTVTAGVKYTF